jgi:uncharacterized membrane protein
MAIRAVLLGMLLLALWNPSVPWLRGALDLVLVLDDSSSMRSAEHSGDWPALVRAVEKLPAGSRLGLVRFGADAAVEMPLSPLSSERARRLLGSAAPPRAAPVAAHGTHIEAALWAALRQVQPAKSTAFLLVSDGNATAGAARAALESAREKKIPVYLFGPRGADAIADNWISAIDVPAQVYRGETVPITVALAGNRPGEARLQISVNGAVAETATVLLHPPEPSYHQLWVTAQSAGVQEVEAAFAGAADPIPENDRRAVLVNVLEQPGVLVVSRRIGPLPLADSLQRGGWRVRRVRPAEFPDNTDALIGSSSIVLDDIAIQDMPESAWLTLAEAVTNAGTGLIVLGGPSSFAGGGYRHSRLESLLPVTAQASQRRGSTAVVFAVDKSGSMDRDLQGASRLAYAREAVIETARALDAGDLTGVLAFDAAPREVLPLGQFPDAASAIEERWALGAGGGTLLAPVLRRAAAWLADSPVKQRLLVLVTDGFAAPDESLTPIDQQILENDIDVVALIIGDNVDVTAVTRLASHNNGRVLRINRIAALPRLMQAEVENRRNPARIGNFRPQQREPLPFLGQRLSWPELAGYMVTRARPKARVYLQSDEGDPLLATHFAGAGRVVALPGGLAAWAQHWPRWSAWGEFVGGLVGWAGAQPANPFVHAGISERAGKIEIIVEAVTPAFEWLVTRDAGVIVTRPDGQQDTFHLDQTAPGSFRAEIPVGGPGRYALMVRVGEQAVRREFLVPETREFLPHREAARDMAALRRAKLILPWSPGDRLIPNTLGRTRMDSRTLLLPMIVLVYLLLLFYERLGLVRGLSAQIKKLGARLRAAGIGRLQTLRASGERTHPT